jgi:L-ribulokinase
MWHEEFDGLPSEEFLTSLDPLLSGLRNRLYRTTSTADEAAGQITPEWAGRLGIPGSVIIGTGSFDAHMGAVGAAIEPCSLVRVMGTSTCDILVTPNKNAGVPLIQGICGQVDGSVIPGMLGMEAGQSAFGDVYAWFQQLLSFPITALIPSGEAEKLIEKIIPALSDQASLLPVTVNDPVALDWFNGRRTPDANHTLKAAITGLHLGSDAPRIFKALVEATAFGARSIVERFKSQGVPIHQVIGTGGVSKKSPFVMQTLADVLNTPIKIVKSEQTCALGAAICAAAASGAYPTIEAAQAAMGSGYDTEFIPRPDQSEVYNVLYQRYLALGKFTEQASKITM